MIRILLILQQLFVLWLLIDALKRRAEYYWFAVIMMPFGAWAYFFVVKLHDPEFRWVWKVLRTSRPPSLQHLRDQFQASPSQANRVQLAQALYDAGELQEADSHFGQVLAGDPEDRDARFGHALCRLGLSDRTGALAALGQLVEAAPEYRDYEPWSLMVKVLRDSGHPEAALASMRELWRTSQWISHGVPYAQLLSEAGQTEEARAILELLLRDFRLAPRYVKRRFWRWPSQAKRLLRLLPPARGAAAAA